MMIEHLWAKYSEEQGAYPLLCHLLDTACAAGEITEHWLRCGLKDILAEDLGPRWREVVMLTTALHDIGKANPVFQGQLAARSRPKWAKSVLDTFPEPDYPRVPKRRATQPGIRRHERVSFFHLAGKNWATLGSDESWLALTALGHHGIFANVASREVEVTNRKTESGWGELREQLCRSVESAVGIRRDELPQGLGVTPTILLSGLTVLADRLASGADWVAQQSKRRASGELDEAAGSQWIASSAARMEQRLRDEVGVYEPLRDARRDILRGFSPRGAQKELTKSGRGMVAVMAPTGSGKTEAALLRHEKDPERLLFFLPTVATTNAIMRRIQAIYQKTNNIATLAHGLASLEDFYQTGLETGEVGSDVAGGCDQSAGGLHPSDFTKAGSGRLLSPITVGTVDQGLMTALPMKWTHLRLLALANAHIVLDEVHTLDAYQTRLLGTVLAWLGRVGARVTLLSATLPSKQLDELVAAYEGAGRGLKPSFPSVVEFPSSRQNTTSDIAPQVSDLEARKYVIDYDLSIRDASEGWAGSIGEHIRWVTEMRTRYPRARMGVFVNTIQRAQEISVALREAGERVLALHSLMTAGHRATVAEQLDEELGVGSCEEGICLVGTQAIEASLDIDLDLATTDLAPAPSLVQRAGRVWRRADEGRTERIDLPNLPLHIVGSLAPAWELPYPRAVMRRTETWLRDHRQISCPADIQGFIEAAWVPLENAVTEDELDYAAEQIQAEMKAQVETWSFEEMEAYTNYLRLHVLTSRDNLNPEKVSTRLIERTSYSFILCDPNGYGIPGALPDSAAATMEELRHSRSHDLIRTVLRAGLNTSSRRVISAALTHGVYIEGDEFPALLRGRYLVNVEHPLDYDRLAGLRVMGDTKR
ncbi:MAG: CRISPR-associated helicase Cas3' [Flaviflexus sp.]|nr:CRISPR-associated helicase Cas3' [Flaviflexus sp.]